MKFKSKSAWGPFVQGDQIGWGPFVQGDQIGWGPFVQRDQIGWGSNWQGTVCPVGPIFLGPFVQGDRKWKGPFVPRDQMFGDRMWGTGSPGIKWVRDQLRRSLFFYDGQFFMKSLMPVNAKLETLILLGLRLFVQHTRARVGHESNY